MPGEPEEITALKIQLQHIRHDLNFFYAEKQIQRGLENDKLGGEEVIPLGSALPWSPLVVSALTKVESLGSKVWGRKPGDVDVGTRLRLPAGHEIHLRRPVRGA
jgi:hypothetical protein